MKRKFKALIKSALSGICIFITGAAMAGGGASCSTYAHTDSIGYTGGLTTWTVPANVTSVFIDAYGAQGGQGAFGGDTSLGGQGGLGGRASGVLAVSPGDILNFYVGGAGSMGLGGYNGGGAAGASNAGGGGGATDVRVGGIAPTNIILVAGGGGGGGRGGCETDTAWGGRGGEGGGGAGENGKDAPTTTDFAGGGQGGTLGGGGAAGVGCAGFLGQPGTVPDGGAGQACCCFTYGSVPGGGGGGGGYVQGGGGGGGSAGNVMCAGNDKGAGGGGAGGSSYTGGVTSSTITNGVNTGNGYVKICYCIEPVLTSVTGSTTICSGDSVILTVNGTLNDAAQYTWYEGACNGTWAGTGTSITVSPVATTTYYVRAEGGCGATGVCLNKTVTVNTAPIPSITQNGTIVTTGAFTSYQWYLNGTIISGATGQVYTPTQNGNYTVHVTDLNGCLGTSAAFAVTWLALEEPVLWQFEIYPNPSKGFFTIVTDNQGLVVNIIDITGKKLAAFKTLSGPNDLDLTTYSNGNYFLTFNYNNKTYVRKITIQK